MYMCRLAVLAALLNSGCGPPPADPLPAFPELPERSPPLPGEPSAPTECLPCVLEAFPQAVHPGDLLVFNTRICNTHSKRSANIAWSAAVPDGTTLDSMTQEPGEPVHFNGTDRVHGYVSVGAGEFLHISIGVRVPEEYAGQEVAYLTQFKNESVGASGCRATAMVDHSPAAP